MAATASSADELVDTRDVRAATQYLYTVPYAPKMYEVYSENGTRYVVDIESKACTCKDHQYRNPTGGCKHVRRVELALGVRELPDSVSPEDVDPLLAERPAVQEAMD